MFRLWDKVASLEVSKVDRKPIIRTDLKSIYRDDALKFMTRMVYIRLVNSVGYSATGAGRLKLVGGIEARNKSATYEGSTELKVLNVEFGRAVARSACASHPICHTFIFTYVAHNIRTIFFFVTIIIILINILLPLKLLFLDILFLFV